MESRLIVLAALSAASSSLAQVATFQPLGVYSGGVVTTPNSHATGISNTGVVAGFAQGTDPVSQIAVTVALYHMGAPGWQTVPGAGYSTAYAISADGSTIAGMGQVAIPGGSFAPFIFPLAAQPAFPAIASGRFLALSGDGTIAAGASGPTALRWTQAGGSQGLDLIPGWPSGSALATGISGDGSVIAGWSSGSQGTQAFRWTAQEGTQGLGFLDPAAAFSQARAVSADGSTIVGVSTNATGARQAFVYKPAQGIRAVPMLVGAGGSAANAVSEDGSVIVGESVAGTQTIAFYWDRARGRRDLREFLISMGVPNIAGWTLLSATAISPDGSLIAGDGRDAQGRLQAWMAQIPHFCYANCDGSTASPALNVADFVCFMSRFAGGDAYANCDTSSTPPNLNVADFVCFQQHFAAGCP